jgi:hypothetical protein
MRLRNTGNNDFQVNFSLTILHPSNPLLSKRILFLRNGRDAILSANSEETQEVMPCEFFDSFCINGYFFLQALPVFCQGKKIERFVLFHNPILRSETHLAAKRKLNLLPLVSDNHCLVRLQRFCLFQAN